MPCDPEKAALTTLHAKLAALEAEINQTPEPERAAAAKSAQPRIAALNTELAAAAAALSKCLAASPNSPGTPQATPIDSPQSILTTTYQNAPFNTSSPTWAKDRVGGQVFMALTNSADFEWTQVYNPAVERDATFAGLSGWVVSWDNSDADNPFLHPFGNDWEFYLAPDPQYEFLAAPSTNDLFENAANDARERGLTAKNILGVEIDQGLVPSAWQLQTGDRVCVWGRWIVDTGHDDFHTEIHPPALLVGARAVYPCPGRGGRGASYLFHNCRQGLSCPADLQRRPRHEKAL